MDGVTIVEAYPPIFDVIKAVLPVEGKKGIVYAYDNVVYNPDKIDVPKDVLFHETIHFKQQGNDPDGWWYRYLQDEEFRLSQEIEAYGEQFRFGKEQIQKAEEEARTKGKTIRGSKMTEWLLDDLATVLSGDMYGRTLSFQEAHSKIRNYVKSIG